MDFKQLFVDNGVEIDFSSQSKTAVLQKMSTLLSQILGVVSKEELFDAYWKRECLGSTALGHGISIPHIRIAAISKPHACFLRLQHPIDFGAEDKQFVDLVVGLVVPEQQTREHLFILREIIRKFSDPEFRSNCRRASTEDQLLTILTAL